MVFTQNKSIASRSNQNLASKIIQKQQYFLWLTSLVCTLLSPNIWCLSGFQQYKVSYQTIHWALSIGLCPTGPCPPPPSKFCKTFCLPPPQNCAKNCTLFWGRGRGGHISMAKAFSVKWHQKLLDPIGSQYIRGFVTHQLAS